VSRDGRSTSLMNSKSWTIDEAVGKVDDALGLARLMKLVIER